MRAFDYRIHSMISLASTSYISCISTFRRTQSALKSSCRASGIFALTRFTGPFSKPLSSSWALRLFGRGLTPWTHRICPPLGTLRCCTDCSFLLDPGADSRNKTSQTTRATVFRHFDVHGFYRELIPCSPPFHLAIRTNRPFTPAARYRPFSLARVAITIHLVGGMRWPHKKRIPSTALIADRALYSGLGLIASGAIPKTVRTPMLAIRGANSGELLTRGA